MRRCLLFCVLILAGFSTGALAQPGVTPPAVTPSAPQPSVTILGAGASSCAKYLGDTQSSPAFQAVYSNWAMGYLTALNILQAGKPGGRVLTDASGIDFRLKNWCAANMGRSFSDAVTDLAVQFAK